MASRWLVIPVACEEPGRGRLAAWAEASGRQQAHGEERGGLRFAFYGRVSTEDWQDPVSSRARQRKQAGALVRGHGQAIAAAASIIS